MQAPATIKDLNLQGQGEKEDNRAQPWKKFWVAEQDEVKRGFAYGVGRAQSPPVTSGN